MKNLPNRANTAQNPTQTNANQHLIKRLASLMITASLTQFQLLGDEGTVSAEDLSYLRSKAKYLIDAIDAAINTLEGVK